MAWLYLLSKLSFFEDLTRPWLGNQVAESYKIKTLVRFSGKVEIPNKKIYIWVLNNNKKKT